MTATHYTVDYDPPKAAEPTILGKFDTLEQAEAFIAQRQKIDAYGVYQGWYGITSYPGDV